MPERTQHLLPRAVRQAKVQKDDIRTAQRDFSQRQPSVFGLSDAVAVTLERMAQDGPDLKLVVDNEDFGIGSGRDQSSEI